MSEQSIINFYEFVRLDDLPALRDAHRAAASAEGLFGTILMAPEGINVGLCGSRDGIERYLDFVRSDARFAGIVPKHSFGDTPPYSRLLVKVKRWIIRFAEDQDPTIPEIRSAPRLSPTEVRALLAEKRDDVILIDTRNRYEVDFGTFEGAKALPIDSFSDFPRAFTDAYGDQKDKTFVFFCTGGVRCEKTTPWARAQGFTNVTQLDGGILKYFEDCAAEGWKGQCFVFDNRWTLGGSREHVLPDAPSSSAAEQQLLDAARAAEKKRRPQKRKGVAKAAINIE